MNLNAKLPGTGETPAEEFPFGSLVEGDFARAIDILCREALLGAREEVRNFVTPEGGE